MTIYMHSTARAAKELPMTEAERKARIELAACYRVFDMLGWAEMIFNHITLRVPGPEPRFLINPFGLHYREVTASSLVPPSFACGASRSRAMLMVLVATVTLWTFSQGNLKYGPPGGITRTCG